MRTLMKISLFGLFLVGLTLCAVYSLSVLQTVILDLGWDSGYLAMISAPPITSPALLHAAIWGALVLTMSSICFALLEWGVPPLESESGPLELNIDQLYQQRRVYAETPPSHRASRDESEGHDILNGELVTLGAVEESSLA